MIPGEIAAKEPVAPDAPSGFGFNVMFITLSSIIPEAPRAPVAPEAPVNPCVPVDPVGPCGPVAPLAILVVCTDPFGNCIPVEDNFVGMS